MIASITTCSVCLRVAVIDAGPGCCFAACDGCLSALSWYGLLGRLVDSGLSIFQHIEEIAAVNLPEAGIYGARAVTMQGGTPKQKAARRRLSNHNAARSARRVVRRDAVRPGERINDDPDVLAI